MFKILIIEDDNFKLEDIKKFIELNLSDISIDIASHLQEAIQKIKNQEYNLVLIDMAIPSHSHKVGEGSAISALSGGLEVVVELSLMDRKDDCVILTQYPEIEMCNEFYQVFEAKDYIADLLDCEVLDCIQYQEGSKKWQDLLAKVISKYENFNS